MRPRGRRWARRPRDGRVYWMPCALQNGAYLPVQMSAGLMNPSAVTVSLMFALVTVTGLSSTDGTWRDVSLDWPLTRPAGGAVFFASAIATWEAASASF